MRAAAALAVLALAGCLSSSFDGYFFSLWAQAQRERRAVEDVVDQRAVAPGGLARPPSDEAVRVHQRALRALSTGLDNATPPAEWQAATAGLRSAVAQLDQAFDAAADCVRGGEARCAAWQRDDATAGELLDQAARAAPRGA